MKKILLFFILITNFAYSQFACYLPDGSKCSPEKTKGGTLKFMFSQFEPKGRMWTAFDSEDNVIAYNSLSKIPQFIISTKNLNATPDEVKKMIAMANTSHYFNGNGLKSDIEKLIKNKTLTDVFVIENLGAPDKSGEEYSNGKKISYMDFYQHKIIIYFLNGIAYKYVNY